VENQIPPTLPVRTPPKEKNLRWASALNLVLPGAGLFYLGRRKLGTILALSFLACLTTALGIFLIGYIHYLNVVLGDGLLRDGQLEQLSDVFHKRWLVGLLAVAAVLQVISICALSSARRQRRRNAQAELDKPGC
jgi:hypothetical protein